MEEQIPNKRRLRKLNLNAPILSTRRVCAPSSTENPDLDWRRSFHNTSNWIPFSWEQVPGTPKGLLARATTDDSINPPLPGRHKGARGDGSYSVYDNGGCDDNDVFSDAVDVFSLSDSLDVLDSASESRRLESLDFDIAESRVNLSPNFIIRRFLPDANALASFYAPPTVSLKNLFQNPNSQQVPVQCVRGGMGQVCSPPKACGIGLFLPWRMKRTLCGLKSQVRQGFQSVKVNGNARQSHGDSSHERPSRGVEDGSIKCCNKGSV